MSEDRIDSAAPDPNRAEAEEWSLRPWLLAGILAFGGLMIHFALDNDGLDTRDGVRAAAGAFFFFGPLCAAFSLERERWKEVAAFSLAAGLVMAGLAWRA